MWIASLLGFCACSYVCAYNRFGIWRLDSEQRFIFLPTERFLELQWIMFVVPVFGVLVAIKYGMSKHVGRLLLFAECLYVFAVAWPLIAILVWQLQAVSIVNTLTKP